MNFPHAIILGLIEGITEFLPISSTGHMILASELLKIPETEFVKSFEIIIQLGAILAVVVLYFRKILKNRYLWSKILAAFLPAGIIGFLLYKLIKQYLLGNVMAVIWSLLIGGIVLILIEKLFKKKDQFFLIQLTTTQSVIIGLFQVISIIPGVSRSAATIVGGLIVGLNRNEAVEFSFLLAIPTMVAATGLDLVKSSLHFSSGEIQLLSIGFIVSFMTALFAIKTFITFVQKHTFIPFGIYRIIIALIFWFYILKIQ
jgi:undecaprenyl-diphosphatase